MAKVGIVTHVKTLPFTLQTAYLFLLLYGLCDVVMKNRTAPSLQDIKQARLTTANQCGKVKNSLVLVQERRLFSQALC